MCVIHLWGNSLSLDSVRIRGLLFEAMGLTPWYSQLLELGQLDQDIDIPDHRVAHSIVVT